MAEKERGDEFIRLYSRHEARLYAYVLTMVPQAADAEEILQEASAVMWRKFDQFQLGSNFAAWAYKIARLETHAYRKQMRRDLLRFSDQFVDAVADEAHAQGELNDARRRALQNCLDKLSPRERSLLETRYRSGVSISAVASQAGRSVEAVYKALQRIRRQLLDCVDRVLEGAQ